MKKRSLLIVPSLMFIISACILAEAAGSDIFSYVPYKSATWDSAATSEAGGESTVITQKVMFKAKKMRMESAMTDKASGATVNQVMIMTNRFMYIINPAEKTGTKFSMESAANPEKYREESARYRSTAKKIGTETIGGIPCDIYTFTHESDSQGGEKMTVIEWRAKDGFVIKSVSEWKDSKITNLVSNLVKNPELSDKLFTPPSDIQMADMDNMMKGIFTPPAAETGAPSKGMSVSPEATAVEPGNREVNTEDGVKKGLKDVLKGLPGQ